MDNAFHEDLLSFSQIPIIKHLYFKMKRTVLVAQWYNTAVPIDFLLVFVSNETNS